MKTQLDQDVKLVIHTHPAKITPTFSETTSTPGPKYRVKNPGSSDKKDKTDSGQEKKPEKVHVDDIERSILLSNSKRSRRRKKDRERERKQRKALLKSQLQNSKTVETSQICYVAKNLNSSTGAPSSSIIQ